MKYIVGLGVLALIVIGGFWYTSNQNSYPMNLENMMPGMMRGDNKDSLTVLPDRALANVKPTEVIELKDGDVFDMEATIVQQEVGNRTIKRLAYNGQIPGPVLKVEKGAKVTVNFTNNIDMETALHSHGLRGDWRFDGAAPLTQDPIPVGDTFTYELEFPDTGVYWYHPHVREDYQQELGLYGNMIVEENGYWNTADQEEYLIFDDVLEDGDFSPEVVTNTLMGRFGDTILINDTEDYTVTVTEGEISRFYITNVANTRTFDIGFAGAQTKLVGGDNGRIEREEFIDDFIIGTSERYVVEVLYDEPGTYPITHRGEKVGMVAVQASDTDRSNEFSKLRSNQGDYSDIRNQMNTLLAKTPDKRLRLDIEMKGMMMDMMDDMNPNNSGGMMIGMGGNDDEMMREHCKMMPEMAGCEPYLEEDDDHEHNHDAENHMMDEMMGTGDEEHGEDGIEWEDDMAMMNQMSTADTIEWIIEDQDTGKKNNEIDWSFSQGDMVKVRIFNDPDSMHPMQHPIHFHGQRFVVLSRDGEANDNLQWKDTVLVRNGETVDLLVDMSNAGKWMAHCHIAEHLEAGMMFDFEVN